MTTMIPVLALAALLGLALGSFSVTAGLRISQADSWTQGRSRCDACGRSLEFAETTPIISFIAAAGRCRTCRAPIDPTHLVGEVAGLVVLVSAMAIGAPARGLIVCVIGLSLLASATVDWKIGRLPDAFTAVIAAAGFGLAILTDREAVLTGVAAAALAFATLQGLRLTRARLGRDPGLGFGDVKLVSALALWLGPATPWMVVIAAALGLLMQALRPRDPEHRLAFGPALAVAAWGVGMSMELGWWPTTA